MKINQFATNEVIFYHSIVTGDTIALELTQVTENIPKTVNPIVQTITDNWFKCQFTSITGGTENLTGGTIYLKYDGYYDYKLKKNGTTIEDSQFFMIGPVPTIIENTAQNTVVINQPLSGSSGTSGSNGAAGPTGAAGTSGSSGQNGSSGSSGAGSSGSSGQTGAAGSSGSSGATGVAGSSGSSGLTGTSGTSGAQGPQGISAGQMYYFNQSQSSDVSPYKVLAVQPSGAAQQTITKTLTNSQQNVLVQEFLTPELGFATIPGGTQRFHMHFLKPASNDQIQTYVTIQLADASGTAIGPILSTGNSEIGWVDASTPVEVTVDLTLSTTTIDPTNRMIVKIYLSNNDSSSHNVIWYTEGTSYYSFVLTSVGVSYATSGSSGSSGTAGSSGATVTEVDIFGTRLGGMAMPTAVSTTVINLKRNLFGRVPQAGNRMFLSDAVSPGDQVAFTCDATHGTLQFSWMPFIGGIGNYKINTILPYKANPVTAETKMRIMFYQGSNSTLFTELNAFYGTYVPNNFFGNGFPSTNTYVNNLGSTVNYSPANCQYSHYFPLPQTLIGYSAVITIQPSVAIGHTQMYAADGTTGFYLPDGNITMVVEIESTNSNVGTFGRLQKAAVRTGIDTLNCSPNWSNLNNTYYGVNFNKANCLNGGSFKTVAQGGMSSYLPPATITIAELAAMFGGPGPAYGSSNATAALHTMVTFG